MYSPSEQNDTGDWIELYNNSNQDIDISNWRLFDGNDSHVFEFSSNSFLKKYSSLLLAKEKNKFLEINPDIENVIGNFEFGLGKNDMVRLYDKEMNLIDFVDYKNVLPWPVIADGSGYSIELLHPNLDNRLASSWKISKKQNGSPGKTNTVNCIETKKDSSGFALSISPNPSKDKATISFKLKYATFILLDIIDSNGSTLKEIVKNKYYLSGKYKIDIEIENLSNGAYFVKLIDNKLNSDIRKFIVQK
jgi:hypothetical protein